MIAALTSLAACSPAEFKMYNDLSGSGKNGNGGLGVVNPPTVCDPFDSSSIVSATSGLKGSIYYLDTAAPWVSTSADLIAQGKKVDADLFLNRLFMPTAYFTAGFTGNDGRPIGTPNQKVLTEWFALDLTSKIKLAPGEAAGDYELAILSDDGTTLSLMNQTGVFEKFIENENTHPTKMQCAAQTVKMDATTKIPMHLTYFQGPRTSLALIMMWRKVTSRTAPEPECGTVGDDYFFNLGTNTTPAVAKQSYNDMLARGWKPLSNDNFELQAGSNRCGI